MLVAHAQTKCPGVASWRRRPPCGDVDCDGGLCSAGEVRARIDGHLVRDALDDAGARAWPVPPSESLAVLGAWHAQGPLPRSITLPNARVHYALVSPDGGPRCTDELRRGTPCVCTAPQVGMACAFRDDETRGEYGGCQLHTLWTSNAKVVTLSFSSAAGTPRTCPTPRRRSGLPTKKAPRPI